METLLTEETAPALADLRHPAVQAMRALHHSDVLRDLLDPVTDIDGKRYGYGNYEHAVEDGLLDAFYYDPETGDDAIVHILQGDIRQRNGAQEIAGFHHEASSRSDDTHAETDLGAVRSNKRAEFIRRPFEPYSVNQVAIRGFAKVVLSRDKVTGKVTQENSKSSMFPEEYDALSVLKTIHSAREEALGWAADNPDEEVFKDGRDNTLVGIGYATMLDGKTMLPIRLILDKKTQKIKTAIPMTKRGGRMNLTSGQINRHLGLSI